MAKKKSVPNSYITNMEHLLKLERNRLAVIKNSLKGDKREHDLLTKQIKLREKYVELVKASIELGVKPI